MVLIVSSQSDDMVTFRSPKTLIDTIIIIRTLLNYYYGIVIKQPPTNYKESTSKIIPAAKAIVRVVRTKTR